MKKSILLFIVFSITCLNVFAQYNKKSDFLYGRNKTSLPYYISLQLGANSGNTFFNNDFNKYSQKFAWALNFEKPLGYRPSIYINYRSLGKYNSSELSRNSTTNVVVDFDKFYDASINFSYLLFDFRGWDYKASLGLGFVHAEVSSNQQISKTVDDYIIPIQVSTGRVLYKRLEFEAGYRYIHTTTDILDLYKMKYNKDKYGFIFIGFKYLLGKKDYRFYKEGECPTVQ